jgi:hypothetical protein
MAATKLENLTEIESIESFKSLCKELESKKVGHVKDIDVTLDIKDGKGHYENNITVYSVHAEEGSYAVITDPDGGTWNIVVKDKNTVIIKDDKAVKRKIEPFKYKCGTILHLRVDAEWSEKKDTVLKVHIHAVLNV